MTLDYTAPLETLRDALETAVKSPVLTGILPAKTGLSLVLTGQEQRRDLAGNAFVRLRVGLNAKDPDQTACLDLLSAAVSASLDVTADGDLWQLESVQVYRPPSYIGLDTQNNYVYGATLQLKLFYRNGGSE